MTDKNLTNQKDFDVFLKSISGSVRKRASQLFIDRIVFAYKGMLAVSQGLMPLSEDGPMPLDSEWIIDVRLAKKSIKPRPQHPDKDIENFIQDNFAS